MSGLHVLDVSNFDTATFDANCFKSQGVEGVIIGCQDEAKARSMAEQCRAADLDIIATYAFLYFGIDTVHQTVVAYKVAAAYKVPFVALDGEAHPPHEAPGVTPAQRIEELKRCVRVVEDSSNPLSPVIYTYRPYWLKEMANTDEFSHLPLWHAHYLDNNGTPFEVTEVNYGGWGPLWAHQWTSTLEVCGRRRDANHYYGPHEEDEMTQADLDLLHNMARRLLSGTEDAEPVDPGNPNGPKKPLDPAVALENARYRAAKWNESRSVADVAYSNQDNLQAHKDKHPGPGPGYIVADHTHKPGQVQGNPKPPGD